LDEIYEPAGEELLVGPAKVPSPRGVHRQKHAGEVENAEEVDSELEIAGPIDEQSLSNPRVVSEDLSGCA
jgi:hypothetical protein